MPFLHQLIFYRLLIQVFQLHLFCQKDIKDFSINEMGLDIGNKTKTLFENHLKEANLVLWNGPLGVYEFDKYRKNTDEIFSIYMTRIFYFLCFFNKKTFFYFIRV